MPAWEAIGHLAGLQAQAPLAPYLGLWTRLAGFRHEHLKDLLTERSVVRAHLLRNTVHLVTAEDFVSFRPLVQPLMERGLAGPRPTPAGGRNLEGVDLSELAQVQKEIKSIARFSGLVFAVVRDNFFLAGLHSENVVV